MKPYLLFNFLLFCSLFSLIAQVENNTSTYYSETLQNQIEENIYQQWLHYSCYFENSYHEYPTIPRGALEAVAFTNTRFNHLSYSANYQTELSQIPLSYGIMGLTLDGKGVFRDNLYTISLLSTISIDSMMMNPRDNILAYAAAFSSLQKEMNIYSSNIEDYVPIFIALSELPISDSISNNFPINSFLYSLYSFLARTDLSRYSIPRRSIDFKSIFGYNLEELQAPIKVIKREKRNRNVPDYNDALWNEAGSCNYNVGRNGSSVSSVTIHYTSGTYSSAIAWFQNCSYLGVGSQVSAHYVIRSFDGQVTQMVSEADKAWHVGSANPYTIGIEHEAYGNISDFFTPIMYHSSAQLVKDIANRYASINPTRMFYRDTLDDGTALNSGTHSLGGESACTKIRGHQHYPNQTHTDPGPLWNWNYYYKLVNSDTPITMVSDTSGFFYDSGGNNANYGNDERMLFLIQVPDAQYITLGFDSFDLETNYDFMWIYDGNSVFAPCLGRWNSTSPDTIVSSGNALLIEFRSDCATTNSGWSASWNAHFAVNSPTTTILWDENNWLTADTTISFHDWDDGGVLFPYFQIIENNNNLWSANNENGFLFDAFDSSLNQNYWQIISGNWFVFNHALNINSLCSAPSVIAVRVNNSLSSSYLYAFDASIEAGNEFSFSICNQPDPNFGENAYYITVNALRNQISLYKSDNNVHTLLFNAPNINTNIGEEYHYKVVFNLLTNTIYLFRNESLILRFQDSFSFDTSLNFLLFNSICTHLKVDNVRVFRSRSNQIWATVSNDLSSLIHQQALNGVPQTKLSTLVLNDSFRFSPIVTCNILVDYTPPAAPLMVNDGREEDLDLLRISQPIAANWDDASDSQSGVNHYLYSIYQYSSSMPFLIEEGSVHYPQLILQRNYEQGKRYFTTIRAVNGAGLVSEPISSDGIIYSPPIVDWVSFNYTAKSLPSSFNASIYPNPFLQNITIQMNNHDDNLIYKTHYILYDYLGKIIMVGEFVNNTILNTVSLTSGFYWLKVWNNNNVEVHRLIKN